jgi:hypothetical protein
MSKALAIPVLVGLIGFAGQAASATTRHTRGPLIRSPSTTSERIRGASAFITPREHSTNPVFQYEEALSPPAGTKRIRSLIVTRRQVAALGILDTSKVLCSGQERPISKGPLSPFIKRPLLRDVTVGPISLEDSINFCGVLDSTQYACGARNRRSASRKLRSLALREFWCSQFRGCLQPSQREIVPCIGS